MVDRHRGRNEVDDQRGLEDSCCEPSTLRTVLFSSVFETKIIADFTHFFFQRGEVRSAERGRTNSVFSHQQYPFHMNGIRSSPCFTKIWTDDTLAETSITSVYPPHHELQVYILPGDTAN
ncbi:hypothetical protein MPTK1_1g18630 [Marchantia polymorpha subsp. ruderalis]|uniref:Uncharacterized protein n=2 Tax=Marchantia polymorpha TaxID=3197 RepID=A0AAF6ARM3_MARPO|nr:hypothetical protein MARPO_0001s0202 [Marchantia polymorpha]BBM99093.1 hypothetical protein Mp_1g18630 [Marchantia polymorpha subsp. ruderalis]|eukprot:PTQ50171.1 hypothetical protein MARPO_0001s0202 [Marchantia polymorpha]